MKIAVISPKCTSESAKYIADQLKLWYPNIEYQNPYQQRLRKKYDLIINYGCSYVPTFNTPIFINKPRSVNNTINKLSVFNLLGNKFCVPNTQEKSVAKQWIQNGDWVVIRETATGQQGAGTSITSKKSDIDSKLAEFYSKYIHHTNEFRVNCFKGKIISVLDKIQTGDIFKFKLLRDYYHTDLQTIVNLVYSKIGIDICGIDLLLSEDNKLHLLEVNSGPMLFGQTGINLIYNLKKRIENVQSGG